MSTGDWSSHEKKIARRVFDAALQCELAEIMAEFKKMAETAATPAEMWAVGQFLSKAQRDIDSKYDFRYSQLNIVFGKLVREKRVSEDDLTGLAEGKIEYIRTVASL